MQRLQLLLEQKARRMQVFLDVIEAEDFLDGPILELDLVVYLALRLLLLLNRVLNDLHSRLFLRLLHLVNVGRVLLLRLRLSAASGVCTLRMGLGALHILLDALLEHDQAVRLLVKHLRQLPLLELAPLVRYESTNERRFMRIDTHRDKENEAKVSHYGRISVEIFHDEVALEQPSKDIVGVVGDDDADCEDKWHD